MKLRESGFTLIETVIALFILATAVHVGAMLLKESEYNAIKARTNYRLASVIEWESERMAFMPYNDLLSLALSSGSSQTVVSTDGYLYSPAQGEGYGQYYNYYLRTTLAVSNLGTSTESVMVWPQVRWYSPTTSGTYGLNIRNLKTFYRRRY